jgi:hypothetical protein
MMPPLSAARFAHRIGKDLERFRFSFTLGRQGKPRGWARQSAATAGAQYRNT